MNKNEVLCCQFGGSLWFSTDGVSSEGRGKNCYLSKEQFLANTDGNTCDELGGEYIGKKRKICRFPLKNTKKLRKREHPKYHDKEIDQLTYEILIETAQEHELRKSEDAEKRFIDKIKDIPIGSIHVVTDKKKDKIETKKIKDIHLNEKKARLISQLMNNYFIESDVKDRLSFNIYNKGYYDLDEKEKRKIRYRINKYFSDFK